MEINDGSYPLVHEIIATVDPMVGFKDADVAVLVGAKPRSKGMERGDLLSANAKIFQIQGAALDKVAKKSVKVCVVGNPANTNALIASHYAPSIPKKNFSALTRLDLNRADSQIAKKTGVSVSDINNIIIWGNHSATQYPDVNHATVRGTPLREFIKDDVWLNDGFISKVAKRGAEIIGTKGKSSAVSAANAACDHVHDWFFGTPSFKCTSMAVISDGNPYGAPPGLMYSFPVQVGTDGNWHFVKGLKIDEFSRKKMDASAKELLEERKMALGI